MAVGVVVAWNEGLLINQKWVRQAPFCCLGVGWGRSVLMPLTTFQCFTGAEPKAIISASDSLGGPLTVLEMGIAVELAL